MVVMSCEIAFLVVLLLQTLFWSDVDVLGRFWTGLRELVDGLLTVIRTISDDFVII